MSKSARRSTKKKAEDESSEVRSRGGLMEVLRDSRLALRELVLEAGLGVFQELLEEDRERLCGRRHERFADREAYRHGHDAGRLVMGGRQVRIRRPRVRSKDGVELRLPTWEVSTALKKRAIPAF